MNSIRVYPDLALASIRLHITLDAGKAPGHGRARLDRESETGRAGR